MKIPLNPVLELLHCTPWGSLASHSLQMPGYPYATALPFVPDTSHCPVFLISGLAEHTRNLRADSRTSLLVAQTGVADIHQAARLSLLGDAQEMEATPDFIDRYVRYQPEAQTYLELGDFRFFRLAPQRLRLISGFGQMGWLESELWQSLPTLPAPDEQDLVAELEAHMPAAMQLLGLDCHGLDVLRGSQRQRLSFAAEVASAPEQVRRTALARLAEIAQI